MTILGCINIKYTPYQQEIQAELEILGKLSGTIETHWHPGSYCDVSSIDWYLKNLPLEVPVDTPTPLFVVNNPESCHSLDNERSDLSIRLSNRPDLNVTRVVPVQFEPKISTQLEIGNLAQGYNAMEEFRFPEYAPAYLVELDTGRFYEASGGGTKEGEVALAAYNHLGLRQNVPEVIYPNQKPFKVYRLCIGAGTWSMLKYFFDNGVRFKMTHLRHEGAPTHTVNYPILPFVHLVSPKILVAPCY